MCVCPGGRERAGREGGGERESCQDKRILSNHIWTRDELTDNGKVLLLAFATVNNLAITNTFFRTRHGAKCRTHSHM